MEGLSQKQTAMLASAIALAIEIDKMMMIITVYAGFYYKICVKNRKRKRSNVSNNERHPVKRLEFRRAVPDSDSTGAAHEASSETQVDGAEEMLDEEDLANIAESKFVTRSPNGNSETSNAAATGNQLLKEAVLPQSTGNGLDGLFSAIQALAEKCQTVGFELGKMVKCFQFMADDAARQSELYGVISKIEGLTEEEVLKVGAILTSDTTKTNFLFSMPDNFKRLYARRLLDRSQ